MNVGEFAGDFLCNSKWRGYPHRRMLLAALSVLLPVVAWGAVGVSDKGTATTMVRRPVVVKAVYGCRTPGARGAALHKFGGEGSEGAVLRALRYLKKNQRSDGSWGKSKVAMTSLALLAYLAHGDMPQSNEFGPTVSLAIGFILSQQKDNGFFNFADAHQYTQPIAAFALAEAYGMTKDPKIKVAAIKALIPIVKGQNPSGGFNYNMKPSSRDDTSYMGWCMQALRAGKMAGFQADIPGLKKCLDKVPYGFKKNYRAESGGYGVFSYTGVGGHGDNLTGVGVLALQFYGKSNWNECRDGVLTLRKWKFDWDGTKRTSFVYYMYYTTQALFQAGGDVWKGWNNQFLPTIIEKQTIIQKNDSGYVDHRGMKRSIGSWISPSTGEHNGGNKVMDTILCTLMVEVYYRYMPEFMR